MWPIIGVNMNLPPSKRYKKENIMTLGLWVGKKSPNVSMFLETFLKQCKEVRKGIYKILISYF
jgi:hypothetical protein